MSSPNPTRRQFLQKAGGFAAALGLVGCDAGNDPASLGGLLAKFPVTDQYGNTLDARALAGKPALVVFGFHDCLMCAGNPNKWGIEDTTATIQQELLKQGKDIPIIMVSVNPAYDASQRAAYLLSSYGKGLREFRGDNDTSHILKPEANHKQQRGRLLHIAIPENNQAASDMQTALGLMHNTNYVNTATPSHSSFIVCFDGKGKRQFLNDGKDFRTLPADGKLEREHCKQYAQDIATRLCAALTNQAFAKEA
jgi:cytochrome oxidase Cu insertion factor (SCO1/SenC/PrrC family)